MTLHHADFGVRGCAFTEMLARRASAVARTVVRALEGDARQASTAGPVLRCLSVAATKAAAPSAPPSPPPPPPKKDDPPPPKADHIAPIVTDEDRLRAYERRPHAIYSVADRQRFDSRALLSLPASAVACPWLTLEEDGQSRFRGRSTADLGRACRRSTTFVSRQCC